MDSGLLSPVRAGTPVEAAVSDEAWLQAMLDAEAALARAQARLGTLPAHAAEVITRTAKAERLDLVALAHAARETANPVVGLVQALTKEVAAADPTAADYVHRGSTSQDVFDTAAMLVADRALRLITADLRRSAHALAATAAAHRDTPMAGRTLTLHAVPTTFGLKAAGWRSLILDSAERIDRLLDGGLPISLGGAAGTLAGYLEYARIDASPTDPVNTTNPIHPTNLDIPTDTPTPAGPPPSPDPTAYLNALTAAYAAETGLAVPLLPWHALRTPMADLAAALAHTTGALGKLAADVQVLARTEISEVAEPAVAGRGASSAMPHKRNPVLATLIRSAALQVPALAMALTQCLVTEDERAAGVWHAEWLLLRECLRLAGGAAHTAVELTEGLTVNSARMAANLDLTGSQITSERVAVVLAPSLGKAAAKALLTEASITATATARPLADVLSELPAVKALLTPAQLTTLLDPTHYTGAAAPLTDQALTRPSHP
ncbi:lyase family protein [Streptacidiphilus sp. N1-3]|uniref:Lyase family protein n=1 Tax=Streptacidiphilus alkalitolerans TaxID=3342712 RepID=A0ABV6WTK7_9ACTN